jgi:hypothetical protein
MKQKLKSEIKYLPTDSLLPYNRNARMHSGLQVEHIAQSIQEFGFLNPILIDSASKTILAGHGRLLAAQKLGLETVPTVAFNHLTDTQRKAYTLADNKLALDADWDYDLLKSELDELKLEEFDLDIIGFDEDVNTILQINSPAPMPTFEPKLPKDKHNGESKPQAHKLTLFVNCKCEEELQELFDELNERGYKVKI